MLEDENDMVLKSETEYDSSYEINSWDQLDIDVNILRGVYSHGFENPSPIQKKAIIPIIKGRDVIAQAQSGTGKTAAFTIGALSVVDLKENSTQVLILSPTRELCQQTSLVIQSIGGLMDGLRIKTLFGGTDLETGSSFLERTIPHIISGCTGRVFDMMRREKLSTKGIKLVILDEADEMLSSGFKEQVYNIFQRLNSNVQVALFSATLPDGIMPVVQKIMRNPVIIVVKNEMLTLEGITQYYAAVEDDRQKYITLKHLFSFLSVSQCIIYCNSIKRVTDLYEAMKEDGFPVCHIHSGMDKSEREKAFKQFRVGESRVLISSNVTARGIDIQQVSIVINFDLPKCVHNYLHRIGRSGRWGRKGVGINFITRRDVQKIKEIEAHYSSIIQELPTDLTNLRTICSI
jgi:translation initiation factor 4A